MGAGVGWVAVLSGGVDDCAGVPVGVVGAEGLGVMLLAVMIEYPWLALGMAGCFAGLWWRWGQGSAGVAAGLWAAYCVYEWLMKARVLCSGECNIRVDLLVVYPVLLVVSGWALVRSFMGRRG